MSTKTLRKRIALVAIAALGFGVLSVAPSNAVISADSVTFGAATTSGTIGAVAANPVTLSFIAGAVSETLTATVVLQSAPITSVAALPAFAVQTSAQITANVNSVGGVAGTPTVLSVSAATGSGRVTYTRNLNFTPDVAGTYVVRITPGGGLNSTAITWTLTVGAALAADSTSTSFIGTADTTATVDATMSQTMATGTHAATITVVPMTASVAVSPAVALTAVITSGPGSLAITNIASSGLTTGTGRSITGTAGDYFVQVFSDGSAGVSTITISSGGVVLGTETVNFYGSLATLTATVTAVQIPLSAPTAAVSIVGKDAAGNVVAVTPVVTTATAASIASGTCTTSTATVASVCTLTAGATAGSSVLTFTSGTITATATIVAAAAPTAVKLAFDKATYAPGEAFTLTLTASNAAGVPADKVYTALLGAALTPSSGITSTLFGASVTIKNGVATATGFMPLATGPFTVSGVTGADATTANVALSATATVAGSTDVLDAINAAADAAAEATDAANAATDAANAAAEAADAATAAAQDAADAVAALSVQVATLIAGLKAQLRSLTNLIIRMQKKLNKIKNRR